MVSLLTICKPIGFCIVCMNISYPFLDKYWNDQRKLAREIENRQNEQSEKKYSIRNIGR